MENSSVLYPLLCFYFFDLLNFHRNSLDVFRAFFFFLIQLSFEILLSNQDLFLAFLFLVFLPAAFLPSLDSSSPPFFHTHTDTHTPIVTTLSPPCITHPSTSSPDIANTFTKMVFRDFPGSPLVKTPHFHCGGHGFHPWLGN